MLAHIKAVSATFQELLSALENYVERCPAEEFAQLDADRVVRAGYDIASKLHTNGREIYGESFAHF